MSQLLSSGRLKAFLSQFSPKTRTLAMSTRAKLLEIFPGAIETAEGKEMGYGFDRGYKGLAGHLRGTGRVHRHVDILEPATLQGPAPFQLLYHALAARKRQLGV
jgi:hypothetical protein